MNINELITTVNDAVWGYVLIFALVGCGVWFTIKTRFVQFRMVGEMLRLLTDSAVDTVEEQVKDQKAGVNSKHISSFQAFAVSVATRVGTGNLAGVASYCPHGLGNGLRGIYAGTVVQKETQGFVHWWSGLLYPTRPAQAVVGYYVCCAHHLSVWTF